MNFQGALLLPQEPVIGIILCRSISLNTLRLFQYELHSRMNVVVKPLCLCYGVKFRTAAGYFIVCLNLSCQKPRQYLTQTTPTTPHISLNTSVKAKFQFGAL
jgi:hypothetical protein